MCSFPCLSQHLIILHLVTFASADFPLQGVLVESAADVDQQSGRTGVDSTAEDQVTHALGHVDTEPQDHTHQQAFREKKTRKDGVKDPRISNKYLLCSKIG